MYTAFNKALRLLAIFTLILGLAYPLAITAIANILFPLQANGSLIVERGQIIGSTLIGQSFTTDKYFQARPSVNNYNPLNAVGSNLAPSNEQLITSIKTHTYTFTWRNYLPLGISIPSEMTTASGSGLDPHISPQAAYLQVIRIAQARNLSPETINELIVCHIEPTTIGIIGEAQVNVLKLNIALDKL